MPLVYQRPGKDEREEQRKGGPSPSNPARKADRRQAETGGAPSGGHHGSPPLG